jgi:hypothetical protein
MAQERLLATGAVHALPEAQGLDRADCLLLAGCKGALSLELNPGAGWKAPAHGIGTVRASRSTQFSGAVANEAGALPIKQLSSFTEPGMMSEEVVTKPVSSDQVNHTSLRGAITGLYGDVLQGWALDVAQARIERLVVEVMIDGACVALARADQFEPNAELGDQFHGFGVQLTTKLAGRGATHQRQYRQSGVSVRGVICNCRQRSRAKSLRPSPRRSGTAADCG